MSEDAKPRPGAPSVFTVGHSNVSQEAFISLLESHGIEVVVDVRSAPYSKHVPHFNAQPLKQALKGAGMQYLHLGRELGGRPKEQEFYDAQGHVRYDRLAGSPEFKQGIERLLRGIARHRVALLCNEEDPSECHRRLLIGRVLLKRGVSVFHIRGNGSVQTEAELARAGKKARASQQEFAFAEEEEAEWKSTRSVSQARAPRRSSES